MIPKMTPKMTQLVSPVPTGRLVDGDDAAHAAHAAYGYSADGGAVGGGCSGWG